MFLFIACAGGGSSSMLCQKLATAINQQDKNLTAYATDLTDAKKNHQAYGAEYDLVLAYGGLDAIRSYNAFEFGQLFDVIFVAPQVRYLTPTKEKLLKDYPTILKDLPMALFGKMDAPQVYELLLTELITLDEQRAYRSAIQTTNKASDKNMELLVLNLDRKNPTIKKMIQDCQKFSLNCQLDRYSLEKLYEIPDEATFDLRFIFSSSAALQPKEFSQIARRIDGVILPAISQAWLTKNQQWLEHYQIPFLIIPETSPFSQLEETDIFFDFFQTVALKTEFTIEHSVASYERQKLPTRKSFLGVFSWQQPVSQ